LSHPLSTLEAVMSHRYRMYPTAAQEIVLRGHCAHARFVYNLGMEQRSWWKPGRRSIRFAEQCRELTAVRAEHSWLAQGSVVVQQQALRDLAQAFANFFEHPEHFGYPTFKKKGHGEGFRLVGHTVNVEQLSGRWGVVRVPDAGRIRFRLSRPLPEDVKSCRVNRDGCGRWHVSFPSPQPTISRRSTGAVVGLDRGVIVAVATSDGDLLHVPKLNPRQSRRLQLLERRLSRQCKGSNRRAKTRLAVAKLRAQDSDRRKDWAEKTSTRLVRAYDVIALEALQIRQMTRSPKGTRERPGRNVRRKAALNRRILASGWGQVGRRIKEKAEASGVRVIEVPAAFTSQTCAACGHVARENRKSQAVFHCRACRHEANADVNAAIVIRERGVKMLAFAAGHAVAARGAGSCPGREPRTNLSASAAAAVA
jgi:putative transposase